MKHPFQRRGNPRNTVQTPFQKELVSHIESYVEGEVHMSGRQMSTLLGRSANHVSQMMNDGLVPSGAAILEMAEVLHLDRAATDRLIRAAMETKAGQRSRDNFWIAESLRMIEGFEDEKKAFEEFLDLEGVRKAWESFRAGRLQKRTGGKKGKKG
jgi:hypothetical protein